VVGQGEQRVGAGLSLLDAVVAEPPLAVVAGIAAPVAVVCPGRAAAAEGAALEAVEGVLGGEDAPAFGTPGDLFRGQVAVGRENMGRGRGWAAKVLLLPACPGGGPEAEPVQAAFAPTPAVKANVPVAVVAAVAVEVKFVLDVLFVTGTAVDQGFFVARKLLSRGGYRRGGYPVWADRS
jgi:hypothetical protein